MSETWNPPWILNSSLLTIQAMGVSGETVFPMGSPPLGGAFTPSQLTGLVLWLKADAVTGVTSGTSFSNWTDSSASGNTPTRSLVTQQPLYVTGVVNGLPVVRFGATSFLSSSVDILGSQGTNSSIFVIANLTSSSRSGAMVAVGANAKGISIGVGSSTMDVAGNQVVGLYDSIRWITTGTNYGTGAHAVSFVVDSASSNSIYMDGSATTFNNGAAPAVPVAGGFTVGAEAEGGPIARFYQDDLCEVAVYTHPLTTQERTNLFSYSRLKWGTP